MSDLNFTCSKCGNIHGGSPAFSFNHPIYYSNLPADEKWQRNKILLEEFCVIRSKSVPYHFIRTCLEIPIIGFPEPFTWGIWVEISGTDFKQYMDTYNLDSSDIYKGQIANKIPIYPDVLSMNVSVHRRKAGSRPYVKPEDTDHPLGLDFYRGLSMKRARELIELILHENQENNNQPPESQQ